MRKLVIAGAVVVVLGVGLSVAYWGAWLARFSTAPTPPSDAGASPPPGEVPAGGATGQVAGQPAPTPVASMAETPATPGTEPATATGPLPGQDNNVALLDLGAQIESVTSEFDRTQSSAAKLIDGNPDTAWSSAQNPKFPQEIVLSFFKRQPVLISSILINPNSQDSKAGRWAKDVEIWTSIESPTAGFTRLGQITLQPEPVDQPLTFAPVEAKFVKLRILSSQGATDYVACSKVKVIEGRREGYAPLLERNADLAALIQGAEPAPPVASTAGAARATENWVASGGCAPVALVSDRPKPAHPESRSVLVLTEKSESYPPAAFVRADLPSDTSSSIYDRIKFRIIAPRDARPAMLIGADSIDTVVLAQVCDVKTSVSTAFKKALLSWVANGHKLIIQDSDRCYGDLTPDYSFLPHPFATDNPGDKGATSDKLFWVEENFLGHARPGEAGYLDITAWANGEEGNLNEVGDSNVFVSRDPRWCGHLVGVNVKRATGFIDAYTHYGRGLIIYDGFDIDQAAGLAYRRLVTRQLALPFDPDELSCSAPLADFVVTTEERLKSRPMAPGRTYAYPLTLVPNQGYKGTLKLSLAATPEDPTVKFRFEPDTVEVSELATSTLVVTTTQASSPKPHVLAVRGRDSAGKANALCLYLEERKTGGIQVVSSLSARKPTKNLEIILDASGSMATALGKKTRWTTALEVLKQVLAKLPDDFHVGLRIYGHRESSRSPKTCTDSELVVPVGPLDRDAVLAAATAVKPRGETPLVYSVLQTPADLKEVAAGSVVLITDGEESCKGDVPAAAAELKNSGLSLTLNIVGFTLTGQQVQKPLTTLAQATGGQYYSAQNGEALARAVLIAAIEKFPYAVFDATGRKVASGEAGDEGQELAPGTYKVVVYAGDQELAASGIRVTMGSDATLRIAFKAGQLALER